MSTVTLEQLHTFHAQERNIFSKLVLKYSRPPGESLLVIATWLWFEDFGFDNIFSAMLTLPEPFMIALANEAVFLTQCLDSNEPPNASKHLTLTETVVRKSISLPLIYTHRFSAITGIKNFLTTVCSRIFTDILQQVVPSSSSSSFVNGVPLPPTIPGFPHPTFGGINAMHDVAAGDNLPSNNVFVGDIPIFPNNNSFVEDHSFFSNQNFFTGDNNPPVLPNNNSFAGDHSFFSNQNFFTGDNNPPVLPNNNLFVEDFSVFSNNNLFTGGNPPILPNPNPNSNLFLVPNGDNPPILPNNNLFLIPNGVWGWNPNCIASQNDRTLFLTFSRGFPVTKDEVKKLFTRMYGEKCIEGIYMGEQTKQGSNTNDNSNGQQILFARVVLDSVATVDCILSGESVRKFRIHGKHIWARKYE